MNAFDRNIVAGLSGAPFSLESLLRNIAPGQKIMYHEGYLPRDRVKDEVESLAGLAYELGRVRDEKRRKVHPRVHLYQKRLGYKHYLYFAQGIGASVAV